MEVNGVAHRREDGRPSDAALRPLKLSTGLLNRADGSARFAFGPVEVLASVTGPQEVRVRDELLDRATLEVNILPVRGLPGPPSKSLQRTLHLLLAPLILLHAHPRSLIQLTLQTTSSPSLRFSKSFRAFVPTEDEEAEEDSDDEVPAEEEMSAAELACTLNAAITALMDAAISMRGIAAAMAISILGEDPGEQKLVLDPSPHEQRDARATFVIGFSYGHGHGGTEGQLLWCESCARGREGISEETLFRCIAAAQVACQSVAAFFRKSLEAKLQSAPADPVPAESMEEG